MLIEWRIGLRRRGCFFFGGHKGAYLLASTRAVAEYVKERFVTSSNLAD